MFLHLGAVASAQSFSGLGSGTPADPYQITTVTQLQEMANGITASYALMNDIDASSTSNWNWNGSAYEGFDPVGDPAPIEFTGALDGRGHRITGLYINRPTRAPGIGMFGSLGPGAMVTDLSLRDVTVIGGTHGDQIGALVGGVITARVARCSVVGGTVTGAYPVGGLCGVSQGTISDCYTENLTVSGNYNVGGLVGDNWALVINCYSHATIHGYINEAGGLIGHFGGGSLSNCFASGSMVAAGTAGGLVGWRNSGASSMVNCFYNHHAANPGVAVGGGSSAGCTTIQDNAAYFQQATNPPMTAWNFVSTWLAVTGALPVLAWEQAQPPPVNTNGLVLHYTFDVNEGGVVTDQSAHGNNATVYGAAWTNSGASGGAYEFDGVNDYLRSAHAIGITGSAPRTVAAWMRFDRISTSKISVGISWGWNGEGMDKPADPNGQPQDGLWAIAGNGYGLPTSKYGLWTTGLGSSVTSDTSLALGQWHHIAVAYDGTNARLYLDGQLDKTGAPVNVITVDGELYLGKKMGYHPDREWFKGGLDDVRVYNRALSSSEVHTLYTNVVPVPPPPPPPNPFSGLGSGTPADPYQITTVTQLQEMTNDLTACYVLMNDIDASSTSNWNWNGSAYEGFDPVGDLPPQDFTGSLEGRGHKITGLYINRPSRTSGIGMFGILGSAASVTDLSLRDVKVIGGTHGDYVGALAGQVNTSLVVRCTVVGGTVSGAYPVGGLCGVNAGSIKDCYTDALVVSGNYNVGGLVGDNWALVINCYSHATIHGYVYEAGGLIGHLGGGAISNCFASGSMVAAGMAGGLVGWRNSGGSSMVNCFYNHNAGNPIVAVGAGSSSGCAAIQDNEAYFHQATNPPMTAWDFAATWLEVAGALPILAWEQVQPPPPPLNPFSGLGSGTPADPYQITTVTQLQEMAYGITGSYALMNDIDASSTSNWNWNGSAYEGFDPVGDPAPLDFTGSLDGRGHRITGLYINRPSRVFGVGMFGSLGYGAMVMDLSLRDVTVIGGTHGDTAGALAGQVITSQVARCSVVGGSVSGAYPVGGLCGVNVGSIRDCYTDDLTVSGNYNVGGLVGDNWALVVNCYSHATIHGYINEAGGLIGHLGGGALSNCFASGSIFAAGTAGGQVGWRDSGGSSMVNCFYNHHAGNPDVAAGEGSSAGCTPILNNDAYFQQATNPPMTAWDFTSTWKTVAGAYPRLTWEPAPPVPPAQNPWGAAVPAPNEWLYLPWFGLFNAESDPWIYHLEHGWMCRVGDDPSNLWLYTLSLGGWAWTSESYYPWMYVYHWATWVYYLRDSTNPRWFFNWSRQQWEAH